MYTVCPKCDLPLAITTADLRAGQGYVRCGRCSNVFNALLALSEELAGGSQSQSQRQVDQPARGSATTGQNRPVAQARQQAQSRPQAQPQAQARAEAPRESPTPQPDAPAAAAEVHEFERTGSYETIVLEGEGITQTEEILTEERSSHLSADDAEAEVLARWRARLRESSTSDSSESERIPTTGYVVEESILRPRRWPRWSAAALLMIGLAAQAAHHWRNELAARPAWHRPLTALYGMIGAELAPVWSLSDYDVRQLGAGANRPDAITVRISLAVNGERAQPVPWLRLTLLDRFGKRLAARDLPPVEYLPAGHKPSEFLYADQRIDAEVAVVDPGPNASSFEVDVCLPRAGTNLRCANDASERAAAAR